MPKATPSEVTASEPVKPLPPETPSQGGSYVYDPATGTTVREGGTEPAGALTPNPAFAPEV